MHKINLIFTLLLISVGLSAQFVNNGATVTIQAGATLRVETDIQNNGTGTITNNGTIEVSGNFTNAGTAVMTPAVGLVKFISVTGSPVNVTLNTGGDVLNNVEMAKTSSNTVTLAAPASIGGNLSFTGAGSKVLLGVNDLTMTNAAGTVTATTNHPTNGYVVTDGTGKFVKALSGSATVAHQIGDATNYTPVSNVVTGSAFASATLGARTVDAIHPNKPTEADSYLTRYWVVNSNGITGYDNLMTGTYATSGDVVGTASRIKGASYAGSNWSFTDATANGTSTVTGRTTHSSADFTGMNALNKVDITVFLAGPLSGSLMTNHLQVYDPPATPTLLPPTSQYGTPASTYSDIGNPVGVAGLITDWVKVEIRDASSPYTIRETRSLLLKTNGKIVDVTGNIPYFKDNSTSVRYAIHHRNHLAILSNSSTGTFEGKNEVYNFSTAQSQAVKLDVGDPDQLQLKNGLYCMRPGDINSSYEVNGVDLNTVKSNFNLGTFDVYINSDIDCNGGVDGVDLNTTKSSFNLGLFSTLINI